MRFIVRGVSRFLAETFHFIRHLILNRYLLYELTRRDFTSRYVQNVFGLAWAIIDPLALMVILWLVFAVGFRGGSNLGVPYVAYMLTGLVCFSFFSETMVQATGSILAYSFLLQKVNFRMSVLPIVKILSGMIVHWILLVIVGMILIVSGIEPSVYWLQVVYYQFCLCALLVGVSWLTSSINMFFRDMANIVNIFTRFLFYLTPVFWDIDMFPSKYHIFIKLNPLFYPTIGYRDSMLLHRGFWQYPYQTIYFWGVTAVVLVVGITVFGRLKPYFADVV